MFLRLVILPPHTPLSPCIHLLNPNVRRPVETAPIHRVRPHGRPEPLPPRDVRPRAQNVLVEEQRPARLEDLPHECVERRLGIRDGAEREDRDERVDGVYAPERGDDQRNLFGAIRDYLERPGSLCETLLGGGGADFGVHEGVGLESYVFSDLGGVEIERGVSMAYQIDEYRV